jgi:putative sigma-54 modulation protein
MQITVQSIHFDADLKLIEFVEEKTKKLGVFHPAIHKAEILLRLDKNADQENKITEIILKVPGKELFAKKQCKTFEEATDLAVDALKHQIEKNKEKQ